MSTDGGEPERRVRTSASCKRDLKRLSKRGKEIDRFEALVETIRVGRPLATRHRDHALSGISKGFEIATSNPTGY